MVGSLIINGGEIDEARRGNTLGDKSEEVGNESTTGDGVRLDDLEAGMKSGG